MKPKGLSAFLLVFAVILPAPAPARADVDATARIRVLLRSSVFNAASATTTSTFELRNISTSTLTGPLKVVLESLDNRDVALTNPDGYTREGKPYFEYTQPSLAPSGRTAGKPWLLHHRCGKKVTAVVKPFGPTWQIAAPPACSPLLTFHVSVFSSEGGANHAPVAEAGPDQTVKPGMVVALDGSLSTDEDGDPLTHRWSVVSKPAGSRATLTGATSVRPTVKFNLAGTYVLGLTVGDGALTSVRDTCTITTVNSRPLADAGPGQTVAPGTVRLDGSRSTDADGDRLGYAWSLVAKPPGSAAALVNPTSVRPSFRADLAGEYVAQLVVSHGPKQSFPAFCRISTVNSLPCAAAGAEQKVTPGDAVRLDGSGSSDVDGDPLTYRWAILSKPAGSTATLANPTSVRPSFTADVPGTCVAQLIVNDGRRDSVPGTVVVTTVNARPVADAGRDRTAGAGVLVRLDGRGSRDADGSALTWKWSLLSVPKGSLARLLLPTSARPSFRVDKAGTYVAQLAVSDGTLKGFPDTVVVDGRNSRPVAGAGADQDVHANRTVHLDGGGSLDADGDQLVPFWSMLAKPPGSAAAPSDPTALAPDFLADLPGTYVLQLIVGDHSLASEPDTVAVSATTRMVAVPDVVGLNEDPARAAMAASGLVVGAVTRVNDDLAPAGNVIGQNPAGGASVAEGTAVDLVISLGPLPIPPDPGSVAPPIDATVPTAIADATRFLYTGPSPIQTGVAPGAIVASRAAVLRGKVQSRDGTPLSGAKITILHHPEFGQTFSRADGMFDIAVNAGLVTVVYAREGRLGAQRQTQAPAQDYAWLPDVVLIPVDSRVTTVDLASAEVQVARGSEMTDADGPRTATLLTSPGTAAHLVLPDGSTRPITTLSIRATEYTVGPNGPKAMPAELPPASAYTYCVELTADEALAAGAAELRFDRPQHFYVEDFLGFPVGSAVPTGFYDARAARWIASANGRVVQVLGATAGRADLDADGDGVADDPAALAALAVTDAERGRLAGLYAAGQRLWRVPLTHFTTYDLNWAIAPPPDATPPRQPPPNDPGDEPEDDPCDRPRQSTIECQSQVLGESIAIAGAPFRLHYRSDRAAGYAPDRTLKIPLSGPSVPASLQSIELRIGVAGRGFPETFPGAPDQSFTFHWDGIDAYDRRIPGWQEVKGRIGYVYDLEYASAPVDREQAFGRIGGFGSVTIAGRGGGDSQLRVTVWQDWKSTLLGAVPDAGLGGWSVDPHHVFDPVSSLLYQGDGTRRKALNIATVATFAAGGAGSCTMDHWPCGENVLATMARLGGIADVAAGPDGSLYIADDSRIRKVSPEGTITTIAGTGLNNCAYEGFSGQCGDGGPATVALTSPKRIALAPDGSIFILESLGSKTIRRIRPDGVIEKAAGRDVDELPPGEMPWAGDGGPALAAFFVDAKDIALGPDGSLYVSHYDCVRQVGTDGIVTTFAGICGSRGFDGDGGPAAEARLADPEGVDFGPDGSVYIADSSNGRIRRVRPDGRIETVAGNGRWWEHGGDGGPAIDAGIGEPTSIAAGPDGSVYLVDESVIRRVRTDGVINHHAGAYPACIIPAVFPDLAACGLGGPAAAAHFRSNYRPIAAGPGALFAASYFESAAVGGGVSVVMRYGGALPGAALGGSLIASEDGREIFLFDATNRHRRTLDAFTGAVRFEFGYDSHGFLASITDHDGNATTFEREPAGALRAIVGPDGHRTTIVLGADGLLASVADPLGAASAMTYHPGGLLASFTNPEGHAAAFTYGADGRLTRDADPAGGFTDLGMTEGQGWREVTLTTAAGGTSVFRGEHLATGERLARSTFPDGRFTASRTTPDGVREILFADGMTATLEAGPDPRFQMAAPVARSSTLRTPAGLARTMAGSRSVTLSNPLDMLSLQTITDDLSVNGNAYRRVYDGASRTLTTTTPGGRRSETVLDAAGRVAEYRAPGLAAISLTRDARGRLAQARQGAGGEARSFALAYRPDGTLQQVTDPLGRIWTLTHNTAGRLTAASAPDGGSTSLAYDNAGNLLSLTGPGGLPHRFGHSPVGLLLEYEPPSAPGSAGPTRLTYDLDRRLTGIVHPDGRALHLTYGPGGRLASSTGERGATSYEYDPVTGSLSRAQAPGEAATFEYDGSLVTGLGWEGAVAGEVNRSYDAFFRPASLRVNSGAPVLFSYDADGLLTQAGGLSIARGAASGLITGTTIQGAVDVLTYDPYGDVARYSFSHGGSVLYEASYSRDRLGRILTIEETLGGVTEVRGYAYDAAGRLVGVTRDALPAAAYTYDANGNRLTVTDAGRDATPAVYDAQDRLSSLGPVTYTHRADGSLATRTVGAAATRFAYDEQGNLASVELPDGRVVSYVIDGRNRRVGKRVDGTLVQGLLYKNRLKPVAELDGSGAVVSSFVYATRANVPDYMMRGGSTYRIVSDHIGSPVLVVDVATGVVAQRLRYDPFGRVVEDTNPGFQPFGFAGGIYDRDTGLTRFGARDYDAEAGRWTAKDPLLFLGGGPNLYAYVGNDPVNRTDIWGLGEDPCDDGPADRCGDEGSGGEEGQAQPESWRSDFPWSIPYWADTAVSWSGWFPGALSNASALARFSPVLNAASGVLGLIAWPVAFEGALQTGAQVGDQLFTQPAERDMEAMDRLSGGNPERGAGGGDCP